MHRAFLPQWFLYAVLPACLAVAIVAGQDSLPQSSASDPPGPVQMTAEQDHQRIMDLLHISQLRRGADGSHPEAPNAANYDESKANPYPRLPDPLVAKNGKRVKTAKEWQQRRAEVVEDFDREVYGRVPQSTPKVRWEVASTTAETNADVAVITKKLIGHVDNSAYPLISVDIQLTLSTPANATGPVPVIMEFGLSPEFLAAMAQRQQIQQQNQQNPQVPDPRPAPAGPTWQHQVLARGWGYASMIPTSVQADNGAGLTQGIIGLCNKGQPRKLDDWGALRAWAWGASRALDYFETDRSVDATRVGLEGHSRYGKAALLAMAYDQRFAIAYVSSSGEGGAKLNRRNWGEIVENLAATGEYHWMDGNFLKYAGPLHWNDLPVDSHELIALCAPRPVFISAGAAKGDGWVDAKGMFTAAVNAGPVYKLLGQKDLGVTEFPPIETALMDGDVGFRQHSGGHTPGPNWPTFLTFAGRYFKYAQDTPSAVPHLEKRGNVTQLIVDGKPFLILGGELHNSSASSLAYMKPIWQQLATMHLNTVLAPVSWELIEPEEGKFDFTTVDGLIDSARKNNLRLVFLWFGSWKNTYSSYVPEWLKRDTERFPRVQASDGRGTERLTPLADENPVADARAFAALMRHIKHVDGDVHTVLMVQVENEVGVIPEARDHSASADKAFHGAVPAELLSYLPEHKSALRPEFRAIWDAAGDKRSGTWEEVFGKSPLTEDLFMAWQYARYINDVTWAGKKEYALPMFANAALIRPNYQPGQYNSGGPLPHSLDLWRSGAPALDFFSPDIYFDNFAEWAQRYDYDGNPLFIPEAIGGAIGAADAFFAIGHLQAIGFSPFGIDGVQSVNSREKTDEGNAALTASYAVLAQLAPLILEKQSEGEIASVLLEGENQRAGRVSLGSYTFTAERASASDNAKRGAAMFLQVGPEEYIVCGSGNLTITVSASSGSPGPANAGIAAIDEQVLEEGHWSRRRRLNGDENGQGRVLRLENSPAAMILRVQLYRYR